MKVPTIAVLIILISVPTESVEPITWAKQLIRSVRNKMTNLWNPSNFTDLETPMPHEKSQFSAFMDKARHLKKLVLENIKPGEKTRDPTVFMTTPQLITINNYPSESHTIVTEDGYLLTVHRIPYSRKRQKKAANETVLLHHGLLGSSADWVLAGPEKSLAYILSDQGYDVWMANVRGNSYSRAHRTKDPNSFTFWNFTFHEVSQFDLPAVIDYIKDYKGECNLHYIGHSMGTTVLFALLSTKTRYNHVLKSAIALAPVAYMSEIRSPIRLFAKYSSNINFLLKLFGANEFLPQNDVLRWMSENMCSLFPNDICESLIFVLCGHDDKQFDKRLLPTILGHLPAGASTLTLVHYAQEIKSGGRFQRFDYGVEKNIKVYGKPRPPLYPLKNVTLPIALINSKNDWLASTQDVKNLSTALPNVFDHYVVPYDNFNHIDFLWATDVRKLVYNHVLKLLYQFNSLPKFSKTVHERKYITTTPLTKITLSRQEIQQSIMNPDFLKYKEEPKISETESNLSDIESNLSKKESILSKNKTSVVSTKMSPVSDNILAKSEKVDQILREKLKNRQHKLGPKKTSFVESSMSYNKVYPGNVLYKSFFR